MYEEMAENCLGHAREERPAAMPAIRNAWAKYGLTMGFPAGERQEVCMRKSEKWMGYGRGETRCISLG